MVVAFVRQQRIQTFPTRNSSVISVIPQRVPRYQRLLLANGTSWTFSGTDASADDLIRILTDAMHLSPADAAEQLNLSLANNGSPGGKRLPLPMILDGIGNQNANLHCQFCPILDNADLTFQLLTIGLIISSGAEAQGGVLLHGALAAKDGCGVLLAGPSNVGKSTASRRLPSPWRSHSDDCSLVVPFGNGRYHVHPWPTWSTYIEGDQGQGWNVQEHLPLRAIFLLTQDETDHIIPLGPGEATCLLSEVAEQAWLGLPGEFGNTTVQQLRIRRLHNICELVKTIPAYSLHFSLHGSFWEQIEAVL